MSEHTKILCDFCRNDAKHRKEIQVVFTTEQTEGRSCKPHLSIETLDICDGCLEYIISAHPTYAYGAQGHNTYHIKGRTDGDK